MSDRAASNILTVRLPDGTPLASTDVEVEQVSHAFGFGNIGFDLVPVANGEEPDDGLADLFTDVFNTATLPFYWGGFEPTPAAPDTDRLLTAARWLTRRGIRLKGHPLVWHTLTPSWLTALPTAEVQTATRERVHREVAGFAGLVDTWDAINEVVIMPVFDNEPAGQGRTAITRLCWERGPGGDSKHGEERQAEEIERHYRTLCTHPAVEAVTYWGITDRGAWLGAPAGLVRADGTPKPAYEVLRRLVKQEWGLTPTRVHTDERGRVTVTGWPGDYRVSASGSTTVVTLGGGEAEVRLP